MWNAERIKERLMYWWDYKNYAGDYHRLYNGENIRKRRIVPHAPFEAPALDNCLFDSAFALLDNSQQQLLINLYMDGGEDNSYYDKDNIYHLRIDIKNGTFIEVARKFGLTNWELAEIRNEAINTMLDYLNK